MDSIQRLNLSNKKRNKKYKIKILNIILSLSG